MTFGVALGSALTTLVGGALFAAVGDMMGWAVLGRGLAVALGVLAVAIALTLCFPPAATVPDDDEHADEDRAAQDR